MSTINNGGAAFPGREFIYQGEFRWEEPVSGMSLRDYFAGQALAGEFSAQNETCGVLGTTMPDADLRDRAAFLYRMADAMIAARSEGGAQ